MLLFPVDFFDHFSVSIIVISRNVVPPFLFTFASSLAKANSRQMSQDFLLMCSIERLVPGRTFCSVSSILQKKKTTHIFELQLMKLEVQKEKKNRLFFPRDGCRAAFSEWLCSLFLSSKTSFSAAACVRAPGSSQINKADLRRSVAAVIVAQVTAAFSCTYFPQGSAERKTRRQSLRVFCILHNVLVHYSPLEKPPRWESVA